ncbi:MAG: SGNH/GDSL hydrolase family protein, partial [Myxococcota bacterium]|nr:SGNH/GDSL hydrolase family protein [Myxococcota bacterium]
MSSGARARQVVSRAALVVFGLFLGLGLAEWVARALTPLQLGFEYKDERFAPPQEFDVYVELNEFGSHDIEPPPRTAGVRRILLLGDSFVQGLAVPIEETVARRLAHHLPKDEPGPFEVVSLAYGGAPPAGELDVFLQVGQEMDPDIVITVFYEGNDVSDSIPQRQRERFEASGHVLPTLHTRANAFGREEARFFFFEGSRLNQLFSQRITLATRKRQTSGVPLEFLVYSTDKDAPW